MQTLWVMRHGLAESQFDTDFNRALSDFGKLQARQIASKMLDSENELPSLMLASPLRRTQETATVVHEKLGLAQPFQTEEMLVHSADHKVLGDFLLSVETPKVMIVSHMPIVAYLCQYLSPNCDIYGFQTAQVVKLNIDDDDKVTLDKVYLAD